jgi:hypothetical protein
VALRLLTSRAVHGRGLTYRNRIALGLLSDERWSMPQDLNEAYLRVAPGGYSAAGQSDANLAFRVAEQLVGKAIPCGSQPNLIDRGYRFDLNRKLQQRFGLGETELSSGRLKLIPNTFEPRDQPDAGSTPERYPGREMPEPREAQALNWPELLPLLQQPAR